MYFPREEYEQRWQNVRVEMKQRGYNAAVVWGRSGGTYERCGDVLYLTNYYSTSSGQAPDWPDGGRMAVGFSAVLLEDGEKPELHMDMPSYRMNLLATDRVEGHRDVIRGLAQALNNRKITGNVALVGSDFLPVKYASILERMTPGISWVPEDDLVQTVRRIKSPRELECYRHGAKIVTRALDRMIEGLINCKSEAEAAADAAYEVTRAGGRFHMIPISHGDSIEYFCRAPLAGFSEDRPEPGDMVRGWVYGPIYQGYWLDPGRTFVAGKGGGTREQKELIEAGANVIDRIIDAIAPGVSVLDVARVGDRLIKETNTESDPTADLFPLYGHGVGLFWEQPYIRLGTSKDEVFRENMVMGIEVFLGKRGVGSVGFEQNIVVKEGKNEVLTTTPMLQS